MDFNKKNTLQIILSALFIFYLVSDKYLPPQIAQIIDTPIGKIIIILISLSLFTYTNPLLAILGIIVAYYLIQSATKQTGTYGLEVFEPTEQKKWETFEPRETHKYTLEEEIVKQRASNRYNSSYVKTPWKPLLDDVHGASSANDLN